MRRLTEFEQSLVQAVLSQHPSYAALGDSFSSLEVEQMKKTGVGAYITFSKDDQAVSGELPATELGFDGLIHVPGVPSGLGCVIDVDGGKLNHIELFTYGDELWDGSTEGARIVPNNPTSSPKSAITP